MKKYASLILRIGIGGVVLWFSSQQFLHPMMWTRLLPAWTTTMIPLAPVTIIYVNGVFELVTGVMLVIGLYTRIVALLLALHMYDIAYTLGYGAVAVRDVGLATASLSLFFDEFGEYSVDGYLEKKKQGAVE